LKDFSTSECFILSAFEIIYLHTITVITTKGDQYYLQLQWPLKKKG